MNTLIHYRRKIYSNCGEGMREETDDKVKKRSDREEAEIRRNVYRERVNEKEGGEAEKQGRARQGKIYRECTVY